MNIYICPEHGVSEAWIGCGSLEDIKRAGCVLCLLDKYGDHTLNCPARHSEGHCTCGWKNLEQLLA